MKLIIDYTTYGSEKYFHYYLMENGKLIDARWSGKFNPKDQITSIVQPTTEGVK